MTRVSVLALAIAAGLGGCTQDAPSSSQVEDMRVAATARAEVLTLEGYWRVASIDTEALDQPYGISLKGDDTRLWWEPACAKQIVTYTIMDNAFSASDPHGPGTIVCDIGYPDALPQVWSAMLASDTIERTPENGVRISGGGRSVTLFSQ